MKRLLLYTLVLSLATTGIAHAEQARPHILIITVDDMNADSMSSYGCPLKGITQNMYALGRSVLRFQYAHVQVGNCMPGRNVMCVDYDPRGRLCAGSAGSAGCVSSVGCAG